MYRFGKNLQKVTNTQGLSRINLERITSKEFLILFHLDEEDQTLGSLPLDLPMISTIIWNARGIHMQGLAQRLENLKKNHHLLVILILEPFSDKKRIQLFKNQMGWIRL